MLRVEWRDDSGKWHTYYVSGTAVSRTLRRERRRLQERGNVVKSIAVERM